MRKIATLFATALLGFSFDGMSQIIYQEDFESATVPALPAGWTQMNNPATGWKTNSGTLSFTNGWAVPSHTKYAVVDDWNNNELNDSVCLVSGNFSLSSVTNAYLKYDYYFVKAAYTGGSPFESAYVQISTNGTDWTNIDTLVGNGSEWQKHYVSLSSYGNQSNLKVRFMYQDGSNNSKKLIGCAIDNVVIFVPPAKDLGLTGVTPVAGGQKAFATINTNKTLGGTVYNYGYTTITDYVVKYQQGSNTPISNTVTGVNIPPFSSYDFTCSNQYTMPGTLGDYPIKMWVELTGDADNTNDTGNTSITASAYTPNKKIFVEEGTGTWCGWCPRGAVYMDSLHNNYSSHFSLVAVHNGDVMTMSTYDSFIGTLIGGYPSVVVDRSDVLDPSDLIDVYNSENDNFGYADITLTDVAANEFGYSLKASVKPAIDLSGDYRLALVLTEDDVHGSGSTWEQANYYSYASANIPLTGAGLNWQSEPAHVSADKMYYDFVARAVVPSPGGAPSSLPATMTANTTYDYTFNTTIAQPFDRNKMRAIVILIRNSDGRVLNSNNITVPLGVSDKTAGVNMFSVYPNPAADVVYVNLSVDKTTKAQITVVDALGRTVATVAENEFSAGAHKLTINTTALNSGLYTVRVQTENGALTQRLSVVK